MKNNYDIQALLAKRKLSAWKKLTLFLCGIYAFFVWILPMILLPGILPYLHEKNFAVRLMISASGSFIILGAFYAFNRNHSASDPRTSGDPDAKKMISSFAIVIFLAVFTFSGAALSANLFGTLVKILPGSAYKNIVTIETIENSGWRHRAISLSLRDTANNSVYYLSLSSRQFGSPPLKPGDLFEIRGKKNFFGILITGFNLSKNNSPQM